MAFNHANLLVKSTSLFVYETAAAMQKNKAVQKPLFNFRMPELQKEEKCAGRTHIKLGDTSQGQTKQNVNV